MKDHNMPFLGIGAASIVLVLTIVCLSVFATLTLTSAQGDHTLSKKNLERTTDYYEASNQANKILEQVDQRLWSSYHRSKNKKDYMKKVPEALSDVKMITYDKKRQIVSFQTKITNKQQIKVEIKVCYPKKKRDACYEVTCFKNEAVGEWKRDSLPVFQRK